MTEADRTEIHLIFDKTRFLRFETSRGQKVKFGKWIRRDDGLSALVIARRDFLEAVQLRRDNDNIAEIVAAAISYVETGNESDCDKLYQAVDRFTEGWR